MRAIFATLAFLMTLSVNAQELSYDVMLLGKKIGTTTISKMVENGGERYKLFSQSTAKVLFVKQSSEVLFDVFYQGGHLLSSLYKIVKDDENLTTTVKKSAQQYHVKSGSAQHTLSSPVSISSIHLYFKEPVGVSKVFLERIGNFVPITKLATGVYEYTLPDGVKNIYRYKSGKLYEVEIKKGAGSVFLRPTV